MLIKTYLRSNMGQERLTNLAMISIESDLLDTLNLGNIITHFATVKSRQVDFLYNI